MFDDTLDSNDGVAQYVKTLGAWLTSEGHKVSYLVGSSRTREWKEGRVYSLSKNLSLRWGGNRLSISLLPKIKLIKSILKNNQLDILHVQVPYSPFMAQRVINLTPSSTAVIGTFHVYPANKLAYYGSKLLRAIYGKSLLRFDKQISVSMAAHSYAADCFGINSEVVPNVVDLLRFRSIKEEIDPNKIVFLGRLVERKGAVYLIKAFDLLRKKLPDAYLVIAGDGPQRSALEKFVKQNDLENRVSFLGYIKEEDKPSFLATAALACFPSLYGESFGIVLAEAMAAGSGAVLAGNNPGYASLLKEKPELLIDPTDTPEFASRLYRLLIDKKLRQEVYNWQNAQAKRFDINLVGLKIIDIYRQAIASRDKSRHN